MKIENCNQFSIFVFRTKHFKLLTELPRREGEGSIRTLIFFPQRPLPREVRFLSCAGRIYLPLPLPLPRNTSLERRRKREIRIYRVVTFPNMNDFSAEYIKDLVINSTKNTLRGELIAKRKIKEKCQIFSILHFRIFSDNKF